jgi:hypothetical protein
MLFSMMVVMAVATTLMTARLRATIANGRSGSDPRRV